MPPHDDKTEQSWKSDETGYYTLSDQGRDEIAACQQENGAELRREIIDLADDDGR